MSMKSPPFFRSFNAVAERFQVNGADGLPTAAKGKITGPLSAGVPRWMRPPVIPLMTFQFAEIVEDVPASFTMMMPKPVAAGFVGGISFAPLRLERKSVPAFAVVPSRSSVANARLRWILDTVLVFCFIVVGILTQCSGARSAARTRIGNGPVTGSGAQNSAV